MFLIVSKYLIPKGYCGLTIFPFVLIKDRDREDFEVLINHERIHIRQQLELLVLPFFVWYGIEFLIRWIQFRDRKTAYLNISFEREAYQNEKDLDYLKQKTFYGFLKHL